MSQALKRASWLELFYDLAFVALIAQLTYLAADHHTSVTDLLSIFVVGYLIFIAWWGTTAARNLQNSEETVDKLMVQLQMVGAFMMSLYMPDVFAGDMSRFFATFALVRVIQILMILRLYRTNPEGVPKTHNILQGIIIATILWFLVGFVATPYFYVAALCLIALDVYIPQTTGRGNRVRLLNVSHLQERLGLFLMLVIGESMLVVALTNTATSIDLARPLIVVSGMVVMISLWWVYFAYLERCAEGVRPRSLFVYLQSHAFLFGSIVLLAAAYKNMLKHNEPTGSDLLLLGAGYLGIVGTVFLIRKSLHGVSKKKTVAAVLFCLFVLAVVTYGYLFDGYLYNAKLTAVTILTTAAALIAVLDHMKRTVRRSKK